MEDLLFQSSCLLCLIGKIQFKTLVLLTYLLAQALRTLQIKHAEDIVVRFLPLVIDHNPGYKS